MNDGDADAVSGQSAPDTIYKLLRERSREGPVNVALANIDGDTLSYRGLFEHAMEVANRLAELGLGRNDRIALVLPDGPEMAASFLAVSCCAVCAPLNPRYRAEDFEFYLSDLRAQSLMMLAGQDSPARVSARALGIPVLELEPQSGKAGIFAVAAAAGSFSPRCTGVEYAQPDDVALVLHTSGTTSRPKIVPLTQRNLCTSARHIAYMLALTAVDRCLNVMPLFHIHGLVGALLPSITAGAGVICTPGFHDSCFFDWVNRLQPTWYTAVPTIHQAVLARAAGNTTAISRHRFRFIRSCSSALPPAVMQEMEQVFSAPVVEAYGMTEASHQMASNPLPPAPRKPGSVGPAAGPDIAIIDERGTRLETGCTGEIVIRGPNVTRGYENNPEANAAAWIDGWFRTGDQGYLDAAGYLFITGRIKELVNRGGEKIAPREIDEILLRHPGVSQAAAFAVRHASLGEDITAVVVPREGWHLGEAQLRQFAAERLADFKVPTRILVVTDIPKSSTGKVQRIGIAGTPIDRIFPECAARGIRPIGTRHQQAAVLMAAAGNYVAGSLDSAALVSAGPAVTNSITGLLTARDNRWPVLVMGGRRALHNQGMGYFQELDAVPIFHSITKRAVTVERTSELMEHIFQAFKASLTSPPGPVYLDLPEDVLEGSAPNRALPGPKRPCPMDASPAAVERAAWLIHQARRPLLIIGEGIRWSFSRHALVRLVEGFGIPFITAPLGRGYLPDDHKLCANEVRHWIQSQADVVVMAGAWFDYRFRFGAELGMNTSVIQADADVSTLGKNVKPTLAVAIDSDRASCINVLVDPLAPHPGFWQQPSHSKHWRGIMGRLQCKTVAYSDSIRICDERRFFL